MSGADRGRMNIQFGTSRRPAQPTERTGTFAVADADETLGLVHVPQALERPFLLVVLLHGAGGTAQQGLDLLLPRADEHDLLLVAPTSLAATWDVIVGGYGPDVRRIARLIDSVLAGYQVRRLAIGGFSDGASYALSLGVGNGDVFDSVLAFSPGFMAPLEPQGKPRIFLSHGTQDRVLPVDRCSRRLVPQLVQASYDVRYEEFDGGHVVPEHIVAQALAWLTPPRG